MGEWISVKDRLPPDESWVLVWYRDICGEYFATVGRHGTYAHWITDVDNNDNANPPEEITHWMPLPEPPKDKEKTGE